MKMKPFESDVSSPLASRVSRPASRVSRLAPLALSLVLLSGCDALRTREARRERADAGYRAAMEAFSAGRIDEAIRGLSKVVADDPLNASARFQLATLLEEHRLDYLEAIRHYREYRMLSPKGDRTDISLRREEQCERLLAPALAKKMKLLDVASVQAELAKERAARAKAQSESERLAKSLEEAETALLSARRENKRVVAMVKTLDADKGTERPPAPVNERDLIDRGDEGFDRARLASDIDALVAEEEAESVTVPFTNSVAAAARAAAAKAAAATNAVAKAKPALPPRPETYVVQEGDTLYRLAIRFYGTRAAWKTIREANKTVIATDGRIRAGETIRLP